MSVKKQFLKTKPTCKVTFSLEQDFVESANTINLVGDFNNWCPTTTPLKKNKNGIFTTTVELNPGRNYQFRYLIDGNRWENETEADRYELNPFGVHNSVVEL